MVYNTVTSLESTIHSSLYWEFIYVILRVCLCLFQGQVFINGVNVGRFWPERGPQHTLYIPASLISATLTNNITVLELERAAYHRQVVLTDRPQLDNTAVWNTHTLPYTVKKNIILKSVNCFLNNIEGVLVWNSSVMWLSPRGHSLGHKYDQVKFIA